MAAQGMLTNPSTVLCRSAVITPHEAFENEATPPPRKKGLAAASSSPAACCSKACASSRPLVIPSLSHYSSRCSPRWHSSRSRRTSTIPSRIDDNDKRIDDDDGQVPPPPLRPSFGASAEATAGGSQPSEASGGGGGDRRDEAIRRLVDRHGVGPPMPSPDGGGRRCAAVGQRKRTVPDLLHLQECGEGRGWGREQRQ
jgi:hypothetical protein